MIKLKNFLSIVLLNFLILFTVTSFAYPFIIVPKAGTSLPTTLLAGTTVPAYYTVTNNTLETRADNEVEYLPPNVTQVTGGAGACGSQFTLAPFGHPGASCTLQLLVSGAVDANDPDQTHHLFVCFPGNKVCAGTQQSLNVKVTAGVSALTVTPKDASIADNSSQQYKAVGDFTDGTSADLTNSVEWTSSNPTAATISSSGLATGVTGNQTTSIQATLGETQSNLATLHVQKRLISIAVTPTTQQMRIAFTNQFTATGTYDDSSTMDITTQVTWASSMPANVTIGAHTGLALGVAQGTSNITAALSGITSNTAVATVVRIAYLAEGNIPYCVLNSDGTLNLTTCNTVSSGAASGLAINAAGTELIGFGQSGGGGVTHCSVNADGSTGSCAATTVQPGSTINGSGLALNPVQNMVYIGGAFPNKLYYCNTTNTLDVTACNSLSISTPTNPAVTPNGQLLFVNQQSGGGTVYNCALSATDGSITNCTAHGVLSVQLIEGLAVDPSGNFLYIYYSLSGINCSIASCAINQNDPSVAPHNCVSTSVACNQPNSLSGDPAGTFLYTSDNANNYGYCSTSNGNISNCNSTNIGSRFFQMAIH